MEETLTQLAKEATKPKHASVRKSCQEALGKLQIMYTFFCRNNEKQNVISLQHNSLLLQFVCVYEFFKYAWVFVYICTIFLVFVFFV